MRAGRQLHQGRAGVATGILDLLQWWVGGVSAVLYPVVLSLVGQSQSPAYRVNSVQHCSDCMAGIIV